MPIEQIVIVGDGVAAWLAAAALSRRSKARVTVVPGGTDGPDTSLGLPVAVEASRPGFARQLAALGLDIDTLVDAAGASFSLGRALSGWRGAEPVGFHAYGETGASLEAVGFQHLVARLRAEGQDVNLANYAVSALAAQAGRFAPPGGGDRSVLMTMDYGLHIDVGALRTLLQRDALARGVVHAPSTVMSPETDEQGLVRALALQDGSRLPSDLLIDASGPARRLTAQRRIIDWSHWLPGRVCTQRAAPVRVPAPLYQHIEAHSAGWQSFTATQHALGEVVVTADGDAADGYRFASGRLAEPWASNVVAIGGAAAVLEPLAATPLHLAASALLRLLKLFPDDAHAPVEAAEYNRQTADELDNARDFVVLHYACNGRVGEPMWDDCRAMVLPDRLAHRRELYAGCGRIALYDEDSFEAWDWISTFDALGIRPRQYDALAGGIALDRIAAHLEQVRSVMLKAVATLPPQAAYLAARTARAA